MPTLTLDPQSIREVHQYGMAASYGAGVLIRRNRNPSGKKHRTGYEIGWRNLAQGEVDGLVVVFGQVNGGGTLTWTPPGGSAGSYMITQDSLTITHQSGGQSSVGITLEEI